MTLQAHEYAPYYEQYIKTVSGEILEELHDQLPSFRSFIDTLPEDKGDFAYAPGKWTIKEVLGHIIDTERIMAYRALRIARNDNTAIPGFDQDDYVMHSRYEARSLASLADEFEAVRKSNLFLFDSFSNDELLRLGTASEKTVSVRALGYIIVGHIKHHARILEERYL
jgi:hypothetical protein